MVTGRTSSRYMADFALFYLDLLPLQFPNLSVNDDSICPDAPAKSLGSIPVFSQSSSTPGSIHFSPPLQRQLWPFVWIISCHRQITLFLLLPLHTILSSATQIIILRRKSDHGKHILHVASQLMWSKCLSVQGSMRSLMCPPGCSPSPWLSAHQFLALFLSTEH